MFNMILLVISVVSLISVCMIAGSLYHLVDVIEEKIDDMSMLECSIAQILPDAPDSVHADLFDDDDDNDDVLIYGQSFNPND